MAAVGITEKAATAILEELKKYNNELNNSLNMMTMPVRGIKGTQAFGAVDEALRRFSSVFKAQSATYYDFWRLEITDKLAAYKKQDASFATKTTGKKS